MVSYNLYIRSQSPRAKFVGSKAGSNLIRSGFIGRRIVHKRPMREDDWRHACCIRVPHEL